MDRYFYYLLQYLLAAFKAAGHWGKCGKPFIMLSILAQFQCLEDEMNWKFLGVRGQESLKFWTARLKIVKTKRTPGSREERRRSGVEWEAGQRQALGTKNIITHSKILEQCDDTILIFVNRTSGWIEWYFLTEMEMKVAKVKHFESGAWPDPSCVWMKLCFKVHFCLTGFRF